MRLLEKMRARLREISFALVVAFAVLMIVALIDQTSLSRVQRERRSRLALQAMHLRVGLGAFAKSRLTALSALAGLYQARGPVTRSEFMTFAASLFQEIGGFRSLQYADAQSVVAISYPPRKKSPVGHRLLETPFTRPFVLKAIRTGRLTVNDPYKLITTGKSGFVARKPIFRNGKYFGLAIGVFEIAPVVDQVFSRSILKRFDFRLVDSKGKTFFSSAPDLPADFVREIIRIGDNIWYLDLFSKQTDGVPIGAMRAAIWTLGAVCSILLGGLVFLREGRRRQKETAALFQAEKLAAVGRLAAGVAHEILNPLNIIALTTQRALMKGTAPEQAREDAQNISQQVERITKVTDSLKQVARQTTQNLTDVDVSSLIDTALTLVQHEVRAAGISVKKESGFLTPVRADQDELTRLLVNLLTNAIHAMGADGAKELTVRAENVTRRGGPWLRLQVSDTGQGISPHDLKHIFEPFFTLTAHQGGTGLGLAICHAIVEKHGGEIEVETAENEGSTFTVYLPSSWNR